MFTRTKYDALYEWYVYNSYRESKFTCVHLSLPQSKLLLVDTNYKIHNTHKVLQTCTHLSAQFQIMVVLSNTKNAIRTTCKFYNVTCLKLQCDVHIPLRCSAPFPKCGGYLLQPINLCETENAVTGRAYTVNGPVACYVYIFPQVHNLWTLNAVIN